MSTERVDAKPMTWVAAAPFFWNIPPEWIPAYVNVPRHRFEYVRANYDHDRSRVSTSGRQWLDYLWQAVKAWFRVPPWKSRVGYISAFPQLPVMLGLLKRLTLSRRPIVAWMFNLGQTYGGAKGKLARFGLEKVDRFIVHSRAEIDSYSEWLGLPRERFIFVPLSIRTFEITAQEDRDDPYVFAMGTANRDYGLLFAAAQALGYRTVIVSGPHAVKDLERPANVTILSNLSLEECHRLSQRATVNVIPVDNAVTASGQVTLLETLMYGKAVVATRCVGTEDYAEDGRTAVLVPPHDLAALQEAIRFLWNHPEERARLGEAGRVYIRDSVSFAGVANAMRDVLDGMAR